MIPKPTKIRSKKLTRSSKGKSCKFRIPGVCNHDNSTVVFCHAPSPGKGGSTKTDDFYGADGCVNCHHYIDNHSLIETSDYWVRAIYETQKRWFNEGLLTIT